MTLQKRRERRRRGGQNENAEGRRNLLGHFDGKLFVSFNFSWMGEECEFKEGI